MGYCWSAFTQLDQEQEEELVWVTEAQEPVFLPAIALSPDCSRTQTSATLKLLSEKKKKKLNWFIDISHNHKEHSRTQNLGPVLQTPISANPGLTLKPLRVTNI